MQLQKTDQRKVFKSDNFAESVMDMDASGMAFATHYLRDKIYSDKQLAVIREYIANALDEHQKFRVLEPVEVSLPTQNDPNFSVRDFGKGLDDEGVRKIFGRYFKSTKNQKNSDGKAAVGGFGIGSKSGHAYADQFTVVSIHKGTKRTYVCPLEGLGEMAVGKIMELDCQPTTEPSGITITVPVKIGDEYQFATKTRNLLRYLPKGMSVKIKEGEKEETISHPSDYSVSGTASMGKGNCFWFLDGKNAYNGWNAQEVTVVVGFVPYTVRSHVNISKLVNGAVIYVSPDDINVALSREDLEFTTETIDNLQNALNSMVDDIVQKAVDEVKSHTELRDAFEAFCGLNHSLKQIAKVRNAFDPDLDLHQVSLKPCLSGVSAVVSRYQNGRDEFSMHTRSKGKYHCNDSQLTYENARIVTFKDGTRYSLRVKDLLAKNPKVMHFVLIGEENLARQMKDIDENPYRKSHKKVLEYIPDLYTSITLDLEDYDKEVKTRAQRAKTKQDKYIVYSAGHSLYKYAKTDTEYTDIVNATNVLSYVIAKRVSSRVILVNGREEQCGSIANQYSDALKADGKTLVVLNKQAWDDLSGKFQTLEDWEANYTPVLNEQQKRRLFLSIFYDLRINIDLQSIMGLSKDLRKIALPATAQKIAYLYKLEGAAGRSYVDVSALHYKKNHDAVAKDVTALVQSIRLFRKKNPFVYDLTMRLGEKYPEKVIDVIDKLK